VSLRAGDVFKGTGDLRKSEELANCGALHEESDWRVRRFAQAKVSVWQSGTLDGKRRAAGAGLVEVLSAEMRRRAGIATGLGSRRESDGKWKVAVRV
jgi:hypothetical protein